LAVFDYDGTLQFTVEVKDNPKVTAHSKKAHYEYCSGVPNVLIAGLEQANNAVEIVNQQLKEQTND
jgi:hypothetical protein